LFLFLFLKITPALLKDFRSASRAAHALSNRNEGDAGAHDRAFSQLIN